MNVATQTRGADTTVLLSVAGLDEWVARIDSSGTQSFLADALGSTVELEDAMGNSLTRYTYEPFGATAAQGVEATPQVSERFTGREHDDADFYYYRARYYQPAEGRFLSEDATPMLFTGGGTNLYSYVLDNPIQFADPLGLQRMPPLTYPPPTPAGCSRIGMTYVCKAPDNTPRMCPVKKRPCTP